MNAKSHIHRRILDLFERKDERGILKLLQTTTLKADEVMPSNIPGEKFRLLEAALERDWAELAVYLINHGADVNRYSDSATPLMIACFGKEQRIVEALLAAGADPNLKARRIEDSCGETALMVAAQRQNLWAVKRLLKAGADARIVTPRKQTAAYFAVRPRTSQETAKIVRELVSAGCPLFGNELHFPVWRREFEMTKLLLESGCPPNTLFDQRESVGPDKGQTPLTIAVDANTVDEFPGNYGMTSTFEARLKITQHLLRAGGDPNLANARGRTPLMLAVLEDAVKFAKVLLDAGADPHFVPQKLKVESAAALAANRNLNEFVSLFANSSRRRRSGSATTTG